MYDGEMWVFGGYDSNAFYNDLYKFNFGTCYELALNAIGDIIIVFRNLCVD